MDGNKKISILFIILIVLIILLISNFVNLFTKPEKKGKDQHSSQTEVDTFKIISSSENEDLENIIREFEKKQNINFEIEYAGTLEIMDKLNSGEEFDAVWTSNSIWLYMLDENIKISNSKSTSINPVVFGIKKSKAEELGFIGKEIYTKDIIEKIKDGSLKFSMSNPTQTNTGATAYLGLLSSIAGSPEVLKEEHLTDEKIKQELTTLFTGLERSSGSEVFLEEMFLKSDSYEAVVTYESSIININMQLENDGKEPLYVLYPVDGVSISDSPLAYIDRDNDFKKEVFLNLQNAILSNEGQAKLAEKGRRTWYGGVNSNVNKTIFNPEWGIDTEKYIVPIKFPSTNIIQKALAMYQAELRKPIHTVFALDYSGSMAGEGSKALFEAMRYILTEEAEKDFLQFAEKDKITVIPFSSDVINVWNTENGNQTQELLNNIEQLEPRGSTNIYDASIEALEILEKEDLNAYNVSVILMTDGMSNMGNYADLVRKYNKLNNEIPIYSIMFGSAYEDELQEIADLTNAKIFDGKTDLLKAFKEVRGYN